MAASDRSLIGQNFEAGETQESVVMILLKPLDSEVRILEPVVAFKQWATHKVKWYEQTLPSVVAKHGAVMVFGKIFDFSENGLCLFPVCDASQFNEHLKGGKTKKSESDFQQWILSHGTKYTKQGYKMGSNNCLYFVSHACKYLEVKIPPEVQVIIEWLEGHGGLWAGALNGTQAITGGFNFSSASSSSSSTHHHPHPGGKGETNHGVKSNFCELQ